MLYAIGQLVGDFVTTIVFVAVFASTGRLPLAIAATIVVAAAQIGVALWRKGKLDLMVWLSLFLVVAFGAASLMSDDPRFVMVKPSAIHFAIATVMLRRGWMLRYISDDHRRLIPERIVVASGYGWAAWMAILGLANIVAALTLSFTAWAWFVSVGLATAKIAGGFVQYLVFRTAAKRSLRAMPAPL